MSLENEPRILVIKLGALGDFVQALGPMAAIRRHHPDAHIILLTTAPFEEFGQACGYTDEVWMDARPGLMNVRGWLSLRRRLNDGRFTRVYDLQNNDRTGFYFRLFQDKPEWVGVARGASHRNTSPERTAGNAFTAHQQTLALAGIEGVEVDQLDWAESDIDRFGLPERYALLVPGASPKHPEKCWPATEYAALAAWLAERGLIPVLIGGPSESEAAKTIQEACLEVMDLTGRTTLFDLPALGRSAALAVGNDTGPMHLIAPTGCPSLVLFSGRSHPVRHAPLGERVETVQVDSLASLSAGSVADRLAVLMPAG